MMATKMRFPMLLLLGAMFLASLSVTYGALAYWETEKPCPAECRQSCGRETDPNRQEACQAKCKLTENESGRCRPSGEEEEEGEEDQPPRWKPQPRPHPRQEQEQEEEEEEERPTRPRPGKGGRPSRHWEPEEGEEEEEEEDWPPRPRPGKGGRPSRPWEPEEEGEEEEEEDWPHRPRPRPGKGSRPSRPWEPEEESEEEEEEDWPHRPRPRPGKGSRPSRPWESEEEEDEEEEEEDLRPRHQQGGRYPSQRPRKIPFYFPRTRFQTLYKTQHGIIRVLRRFDTTSNKLENLQNYRLLQIEAKPSTLILPKHADDEAFLVVQQGEATIHLADANNRESYNLKRGDALRIPSGTISYIINRGNNRNLRIAKLVIPVNRPGKFEDFFPANNQDQESYFRGFSRNTLEAAFNSPFEDIKRILLGDVEEQGQKQGEEEGVIVRLSKEQIKELTRHAKSSSKGSVSAESGPFNLRSSKPIYSNEFGKLYEVTPDRNPQLRDLDLLLNCLELEEGSLMLPHFNTRSIKVLVVNQGKAKIEVVGPKDKPRRHQQFEEEEEQEGRREVRRYSVRLSRGDVFVLPAAYPVAINASSDFHLLAFGINAKNNQINFLAGERDNVLNQIHRQVKELAFPGSGQQVERLIRRQKESYFVSAQPQQRKEGRRERGRGPLSSILSAFY